MKPAKKTAVKIDQIERHVKHIKRMYFIRGEGQDMIDKLYETVYQAITKTEVGMSSEASLASIQKQERER